MGLGRDGITLPTADVEAGVGDGVAVTVTVGAGEIEAAGVGATVGTAFLGIKVIGLETISLDPPFLPVTANSTLIPVISFGQYPTDI